MESYLFDHSKHGQFEKECRKNKYDLS
jgi:hypothetical protein